MASELTQRRPIAPFPSDPELTEDITSSTNAAPPPALASKALKKPVAELSTWDSARLGLKYSLLTLAAGGLVLQGLKFLDIYPPSSSLSSQRAPPSPPRFSWTKSPDFSSYKPIFSADVQRRDAVKEAFTHSWHAYERDAWGTDDYHPISRKGSNISEHGGIGYTIVDSLDTLLVMDLQEEYGRARDWVESSLSFDVDVEFNAFEITIRLLGGLLSAYALTPNPTIDQPLYLRLATDLAGRLLATYQTPTGIPLSKINLGRRQAIADPDSPRGAASLAEAGSLQLEMKYLSEISGDAAYWKAAEKVMDVIRAQPSMEGLLPIFVSPETGQFFASEIRLGSRGDSYYEYLLKQYLQTDGTEPIYRTMYDEAMQGIKSKLIYESNDLLYTAELAVDRQNPGRNWQVVPKQDHLVCFLGGSFLLGVTEARLSVPPIAKDFSEADREDWTVGEGIIRSCVDTYEGTETGLAPEIAFFRPKGHDEDRDWYVKQKTSPSPLIDARNILRPETVESLFLAFRLTGDPIYREKGWAIFQAFQKHCRIETGGYVSILDVNQVPVEHEDRMETFWLSETLKYLYLLFADSDVIPLDAYVFNTEAHILPVFVPTVKR